MLWGLSHMISSLSRTGQRHGRLSIPTAPSTQCYLNSPITGGAWRSPPPPTRWIYSSHVCVWLLVSLVCMLGSSFIEQNTNPHSIFPHPYSLVHIYTRSDLHNPLLRYPPLLPQKAGRPKQHRRHKSGFNAKKRSRAPPTCALCGMDGRKSNNTSWHSKTWDDTNSIRHWRTHLRVYLLWNHCVRENKDSGTRI